MINASNDEGHASAPCGISLPLIRVLSDLASALFIELNHFFKKAEFARSEAYYSPEYYPTHAMALLVARYKARREFKSIQHALTFIAPFFSASSNTQRMVYIHRFKQPAFKDAWATVFSGLKRYRVFDKDELARQAMARFIQSFGQVDLYGTYIQKHLNDYARFDFWVTPLLPAIKKCLREGRPRDYFDIKPLPAYPIIKMTPCALNAALIKTLDELKDYEQQFEMRKTHLLSDMRSLSEIENHPGLKGVYDKMLEQLLGRYRLMNACELNEVFAKLKLIAFKERRVLVKYKVGLGRELNALTLGDTASPFLAYCEARNRNTFYQIFHRLLMRVSKAYRNCIKAGDDFNRLRLTEEKPPTKAYLTQRAQIYRAAAYAKQSFFCPKGVRRAIESCLSPVNMSAQSL